MARTSEADRTEKISAVEWRQPPVVGKYDWAKIADQLRKRPMEWARVFEQDRAAISNAVKQGSVTVVHPDLGFEFRTAKNHREPPRLCDLYMRYNPDKVSPLRDAVRSQRKDG
jgi:hypothetical protein